MGQSRMLISGVALVLLLGGVGFYQWRDRRYQPREIGVTHKGPPDPRSTTSLPPMPDAAKEGAQRIAAPAQTSAPAPEAAAPVRISVHIVGAVRKPDVYHLSTNSRVEDAIHAAGGPLPGADLEAVNLASVLQDGEQVRIPTHTEMRALRTPPTPGRLTRAVAALPHAKPVRTTARYPVLTTTRANPEDSARPEAMEPAPASDAVVNLNSATAEELDTLPGVGPATATKILEYRKENGPFQRVEDLLEVSGIGEKKLERMRDRVMVR